MTARERWRFKSDAAATGRRRNPGLIRRSRQGTAALLLVIAGPLLAASVALAQTDALPKLMSGTDVTIPAGQVIAHDLYVVAGTIVVDGRVQGDLVAAGGRVEVNGSVDGDLVVAAGAVDIRGPVAGDLRAAGATVTISATIEEDAAVSGGSIEIGQDGAIGQDLIVSGGRLEVAGTIAGDVLGSAGIRTGDGAVGGDDSLVTGTVGSGSVADTALDAVRHILAVAVLGAIALLIAPQLLPIASASVRRKPLLSMAWGIATFLGAALAVALVVLLGVVLALILGAAGYEFVVTVELLTVAMTVGAIGLGVTFGSVFLADAVVGLALATLVSRIDGMTRRNAFVLAVSGSAAVTVAASVPVAGPWIKAVVVLIGVGGLAAATRAVRRGGDAVPTA